MGQENSCTRVQLVAALLTVHGSLSFLVDVDRLLEPTVCRTYAYFAAAKNRY